MNFRHLLVASLCSVCACAHADTTAIASNRTVGTQSFNGALGMDFNVLSSIVVTHLGAFDSGLNGFSSSIQVGIFDRNTQSLVGPSASFLGTAQPLIGSVRFFDIADFTLAPGQYSIVASGFNALDLNGNLNQSLPGPTANTGGGLISFVGSSRYTTTSALVFPTVPDIGSSTTYDAGTFRFTSAVPEVSTLATMSLGLALVSGVIRRRRGN